MEEKLIERAICKNCNETFSTEYPNYRLTSCQCGRISVDTTPHYARVIGEFEDYRFESNNPKVLENWKKQLDEYFKTRLN